MYQALYRKYRPKTLNDVVGQEIIIKTLTNTLKNNKLSHAYLFTGPRGTGKTSVAKILARVINCTEPVDYNPCGKCVNCTQTNNIDVIEIDAASNNGVDEIRELKNKINLVPSLGKYKIYIIDEVHMLSIGAFNALLKTLEEPPSHAVFILATTEPHKIPMTILSRCQRLDFKKISNESIIEKLKYVADKENITIDEEAISEIARLSDGGLRDAISMLDQVNSYSDDNITLEDVYEINGILNKDKMNEFINNLFDSNLSETLNSLDEYNSNGKNLVKLFEEIMFHMKNILIYKTAPQYFTNKNEDISIYESISSKVNNVKLMKVIQIFSEALNEVKFSNNPKLKIELILIRIMNENSETIKAESKKITISEPKIVKEQPKAIVKEDVIPKNIDNIEQKHIEEIIKSKEDSTNTLEKPQKREVKKVGNAEKLCEIRINNTLSRFDKKATIELKNTVLTLRDKLFEVENKEILSLVLDADLKAASNENVIFVLDDKKMSEYFNSNMEEIESILEKYLHNKYRVISVGKDYWEIIKKEFNSKTKSYEYMSEDEVFKDIPKDVEEEDMMSDMFGEIVEYN